MKPGDRVLIRNTGTVLDSEIGRIGAPTADGPWDWWVDLEDGSPRPFGFRESELLVLS